MQHREFEPPAELRDTIKCFWYNRRELGEHLASFEVLPDGYAEIVFHFGSACHISGNGSSLPLPSPFLMGLLNRPVVFNARNCFEIIGVRCFPWTVFDLLELPSGQDGVRVFEHPLAELQPVLERYISTGKIETAIAEAEGYFLKARPQLAVDTTLLNAGMAMRESKGTLPVSHVAIAAHATVRTLERKFKHSSGYTVKGVSGLMRFEQARNQLWLEPDSNLVGLAHDLGYSDQSHFSREFKRYSGTTPAAFARKAKREKQAANQDFVAFIQA